MVIILGRFVVREHGFFLAYRFKLIKEGQIRDGRGAYELSTIQVIVKSSSNALRGCFDGVGG
jgi:hypothetical protein